MPLKLTPAGYHGLNHCLCWHALPFTIRWFFISYRLFPRAFVFDTVGWLQHAFLPSQLADAKPAMPPFCGWRPSFV
jgi:hypothetical protein